MYALYLLLGRRSTTTISHGISYRAPLSLTHFLITSIVVVRKTQVNPSSAFNRTKHHQSDPSNVLGILGSNYLKRACAHTSKSFSTQSNRILSYNRIRSPTGFLSSDITTSLVYLTSIACVRGVSLCSLERQDSPLLQGLKVEEDPLSKILTSTLPHLLLTGKPGSRTDSHSIRE